MNCQQFTTFIVEVARGQMMDAAARDGALRHAESCQACAARLAQEQSLTNALRAVAHGMKDLSAHARTEAKLLAAFHERLAHQNAQATTGASGDALVSPRADAPVITRISGRRARRVAFAATAIAASLVLVLLASLYLRFTRTAPQSQDIASVSQPTGSNAAPNDTKATSNDIKATPTGSELTMAAPSLAPSTGNERRQQRARETTDTNRGTVRRIASQSPTGKLAARHIPTMIEAQHVIDGGNAIIEASETATAANSVAKSNNAESMTEFISLVADAPATPPLESGQLVRVQVPRAALASLGLPLNVERGNEPVKADVLLGADGLARAIRFVR